MSDLRQTFGGLPPAPERRRCTRRGNQDANRNHRSRISGYLEIGIALFHETGLSRFHGLRLSGFRASLLGSVRLVKVQPSGLQPKTMPQVRNQIPCSAAAAELASYIGLGDHRDRRHTVAFTVTCFPVFGGTCKRDNPISGNRESRISECPDRYGGRRIELHLAGNASLSAYWVPRQ